MDHQLLVALGSNLTSPVGPPADTLDQALDRLVARGAVVERISAYYNTPAFPVGAGPDYVNAAARISANWAPAQALSHLHAVEADMGRERGTRWGQRTLDLDLLAMGDLVLPDAQVYAHWRDLPLEDQARRAPEQLILPHPRLQDRAFVLVPLSDVAPDWRHPVLGRTVLEMRDALSPESLAEVRLIL